MIYKKSCNLPFLAAEPISLTHEFHYLGKLGISFLDLIPIFQILTEIVQKNYKLFDLMEHF